ncbi:MAG: DUF948 domain-containing protein [Actinobacteria bacterium]|nr:DUF948 domain-containing protein [Actinomycetota bacterium]
MEWDADAIMRIAIGVFFVLFGVGIAYALVRLATVFKRLSSILADANTRVVPLLTRLEGTLDGVNSELGKVDELTGSVAGIVKTAEQATTAVQSAVSKPMKKMAGATAAVNETLRSFFGTGPGKER